MIWGEPFTHLASEGISDARRIEGILGTWAYVRPYINCGVSEGVVVEICGPTMPTMSIRLDPKKAHLLAQSIMEMIGHLVPKAEAP